jgi:ABC-type sugar transport system permease subunit
VFFLWPLVRSLFLSLEQAYGPGTTEFVGGRNFTYLLHDPQFWKALRNTVGFTLASLALQIPLSLGLALLLNRPRLRGRSVFRLVFFAPSLVGLVYAALIVAQMFDKRTGLVNLALHSIFPAWNPDFPWLEQHVMATLVLSALWLYTGFNMVYLLAALQNVPPELWEAATIDGANPWQRFWNVTLPQIRPVMSVVVLLSVTIGFQLFELPYIIFNTTGNPAGPDDAGLTIVMYLYQTGFLAGDLGYACAIGWILAVLLITVALFQRWLVRLDRN